MNPPVVMHSIASRWQWHFVRRVSRERQELRESRVLILAFKENF
jgi:hypothetical protein